MGYYMYQTIIHEVIQRFDNYLSAISVSIWTIVKYCESHQNKYQQITVHFKFSLQKYAFSCFQIHSRNVGDFDKCHNSDYLHRNQYVVPVQLGTDQLQGCVCEHVQTLSKCRKIKSRTWLTCRLRSFASELRPTSLKASSSACNGWSRASPSCNWRQWDTRSSASLLLAMCRWSCC